MRKTSMVEKTAQGFISRKTPLGEAKERIQAAADPKKAPVNPTNKEIYALLQDIALLLTEQDNN